VTREAPYQIGDEAYIQEDNHCPKCNVFYNNKMRLSEHIEQCDKNYKYKATIEDVKVVRIRELSLEQMLKTTGFTQYQFEENGWGIFIDWYNKQYVEYEDNPYVFLYEVKEPR
jgi:hypothetical protein